MGKQIRKKKKQGIRKKQFIILIVGVCAVALIAEAALLISTFSRKKPDKPVQTTVSPTEEVLPVEEDYEDDSDDEPVEHKTVWRLAREDVLGNNGFTVGHIYDSMGREIRRVEYKPDGVTPKSTVILKYDAGGMIFAETWIPDEEGSLEQTKCYFPSAAGFDTLDYWVVNMSLEGGEIVEEVSYSNDGHLQSVISSFPADGSSSAKKQSRWEFGDDGLVRFHLVDLRNGNWQRRYEFRYDKKERLNGITYFEGSDSGIPEYAIHYKGNQRIVVQRTASNFMIYTFRDEQLLKMAMESNQDAWGRLSRRKDPDLSIQDGWLIWYHYPKICYPYMDHTTANLTNPAYKISAEDEFVYVNGVLVSQPQRTILDAEANPVQWFISVDPNGDAREPKTECTRLDFVYGSVIRTRTDVEGMPYDSMEKALTLMTATKPDKDVTLVEQSFKFDNDENLTFIQRHEVTAEFRWVSVYK